MLGFGGGWVDNIRKISLAQQLKNVVIIVVEEKWLGDWAEHHL